ncbi:MAG: ABC transporter permease [Pirellulales bacterium]|nr:ABC transporter permease [Pirellulales bacterium]
MNVWLILRVSWVALTRNKLRAGLTVLGIVIGVAAVVTTVSIGLSAGRMVQQQFESLGSNVIFVFPRRMEEDGGVRGSSGAVSLTAADADAITRDCPSVRAATPIVPGQGQIVYANVNWMADEMHGVSADYLVVRNWGLSQGGFFSDAEVRAAGKVCVIGQTIVRELFQGQEPIGKTIRIKNVPFEVIGVFEPKGANMFGQDQDNILVVPFTTVQTRLAGTSFNNVGLIMVSATSLRTMSDAQFEIETLLAERHHIRPGRRNDFHVENTSEFARVLGIITGIMTMLLSAIASVSLLVGGVGIMNIMLVSVSERTREIGIRLAVGARGRDILRQFLVEATLLSLLGGLVGVACGIAASVGITLTINQVSPGAKWPIVVSPSSIVLALAVTSAVGMFFGFYPARKASQLDPIESLRYE